MQVISIHFVLVPQTKVNKRPTGYDNKVGGQRKNSLVIRIRNVVILLRNTKKRQVISNICAVAHLIH